MIAALIIAAVLFYLHRKVYQTALSPDGLYYNAMGQGMVVPRPYSLRYLPKVIKSETAWHVVSTASYFASVALASLCVEALHFGYVAQIAAGLAVAVVPMTRFVIARPVLLDGPLLLACLLTAYASLTLPVLVPLAIVFAWFIHERGAILAALYAAPHLDTRMLIVSAIMVVLCAGVTALQYLTSKPHPDETNVAWLKSPLTESLKNHAVVLNDWRVWLLPWGGLVLGFAGLSLFGAITVVVCYAMCFVAMDRVRIYQMAVFPVVLGLLAVAPEAWLLPLVAVTWFTKAEYV